MAGRKRRTTSRKRALKAHPIEIWARRQAEAAKNDPRLVDLVKAAGAGNIAGVRRLLKLGLDPSALPPDGGDDTAVLAAVHARSAEVVRVLAKAGADLNDGWPYKPLGLAARWGHFELVRALIAGGADVHLPDDSGDTPLDEAVDEKHLAIIEELLRAGADPNFVSDENRDRGNVHSPLQRAAYDKEVLEVFRKHGGGKDFSATLLIGAAGLGDLAEVKRLVAEGADVNAVDADGQFPLIVAAGTGKLNVVKFLVESGAKVDQRFRGHRAARAMTALDYAKQARQKKVVEYLLSLQQNGKAGRKTSARQTAAAAAKRPTGVPTFDVNDTCVLLETAVDAAATALVRHLGAKVHEKNVLGEKVTLTKRCFAVFRIVGQPWSIIMRLNCADVGHYLKPRDGQALSKALNSRAIVVIAGDTSGIYQYVTFDKGKPVELLDYGSSAGDSDRAAVTEQFKRQYGIDLRAFRNLDVAGSAVAGSSLRKLKLSSIRKPLEFISDHLKQQNAFVPFFGDSWGGAGDRVELTLEGLGPDDIERLDYVAG